MAAVRVARTLDLASSEEECGDTPLELVRRAVGELAPDEVLEVRSTVAEHAFTVRAWARKAGWTIVADETEGNQSRILVQQTAAG
jgi:TusA-related sulfurtransferase